MSGLKDSLLGDTPLEQFIRRGQRAQVALDMLTYPEEVPVEVCELFESLALGLARDGWKQYSADAVLHRIRWHYHIDKGDRDFKANNNWTSALARWFLRRHPEMPTFFETRKSPEPRE